MRRIPAHVMRRNRNASEADANAAYYSPATRGQYLLDRGDGQGAISVDVRALIRENDFSPRENRQIFELRAGEAMNLGGGAQPLVTLHCIVQQAKP